MGLRQDKRSRDRQEAVSPLEKTGDCHKRRP